jgi:hypothetical protein
MDLAERDVMQRTRYKRNAAGVMVLALLAVIAAEPARAGDSPAFDRFCAQWMAKLAQREHQNLARVRWENQGGSLVGRYTGYAREPIHCNPTSTVTPGRPAVGKLVYQEILYQKSGSTAAAAARSQPAVLQTTEVMEVFRYDGRDWKY